MDSQPSAVSICSLTDTDDAVDQFFSAYASYSLGDSPNFEFDAISIVEIFSQPSLRIKFRDRFSDVNNLDDKKIIIEFLQNLSSVIESDIFKTSRFYEKIARTYKPIIIGIGGAGFGSLVFGTAAIGTIGVAGPLIAVGAAIGLFLLADAKRDELVDRQAFAEKARNDISRMVGQLTEDSTSPANGSENERV